METLHEENQRPREALLPWREPLGCHKDFRQYALGRVVLSEGLRRLQSLGAQDIFVETDNYRNTAFRLYESFDFRVIQDVLVYRKDYGDIQTEQLDYQKMYHQGNPVCSILN